MASLALLFVGVAALGHFTQQGESLLAGHLRRKQVRATNGDAAGVAVYLPLGKVDLGAAADPKAET